MVGLDFGLNYKSATGWYVGMSGGQGHDMVKSISLLFNVSSFK